MGDDKFFTVLRVGSRVFFPSREDGGLIVGRYLNPARLLRLSMGVGKKQSKKEKREVYIFREDRPIGDGTA